MNTTQIMIALIDPAARPALTIAGIFFLIINLLAGAYIVRHWRRLFGRDPRVDGDRDATRYLQIVVITIPWLFLTFRLVAEVVGFWTD
jgi:Na+-driven multidrug efflux pump